MQHKEFQDFTVQVLASVKGFDALQGGVKQAKAAIDILQGKGTAADLKTLGLDMADGWKQTNTALDAFLDKLEKLGSIAPNIKKDFKLDEQINQARALYLQLVDEAAGDPKLIYAAMQKYNKVVAEVQAKAAADAAKNFPLDDQKIIERIIYVESKGVSTASPGVAGSHALGIGQFEPQTWVNIFKQVFPNSPLLGDNDAILALRTNNEIAKQMLEALTRQNELALAQAHVPVTAANTYLAHFLGPQTAIAMIKGPIDELASKIVLAIQGQKVGSAAIRSNPILGGSHTVGDVLGFAQSKMAGIGGPSPITSTGETEIEKVNTDLDAQVLKWQDEAKAVTDATTATKLFGDGAQRALFIQQQISEWQQKYKAAGGPFSDEDRARVTQYAGALFDVQHAAENAQKAVSQVVGLSEQRTTAVQELHTAMSDGSSVEVQDQLRQKVDDLNKAILAALPNAVTLAATLGDQKQIEALQKVIQQLQTLKVGLTDAKQMNTMLADSGVTAWNNFTQAMATSRKVLVNLRNAFLSFVQDFLTQSENMILKQQILNALSGTGVGDWLSKMVNSASGTGGAGDAAGGAALQAAGTTLSTAGGTLSTAGETLSTAGFSLGTAATALQAAAAALTTGGAASAASGMANFASTSLHTGGIVGSAGARMSVSSAIFAGAKRFHSGGLPGLRSNEVAAVLEKGEEVLTRGDPRHVLNGGVGTPTVHLRNVNVFDPGDAFAAGLGSTVGEKTVFNFFRNNKSAIKAVLA